MEIGELKIKSFYHKYLEKLMDQFEEIKFDYLPRALSFDLLMKRSFAGCEVKVPLTHLTATLSFDALDTLLSCLLEPSSQLPYFHSNPCC